ncbi:MAG: YDG domain-containing protein, partial [Opitutales bacterium]
LSSSYGGADAGNYTITDQDTTTADITPAGLVVSGITADDKVYDATTDATIDDSGAAFAGLFAGDTVTVSAAGAFADKNAGTAKTVNLSSSYGGADAGNYTITDQATTTADITPAALSVSGLTAEDKVYDATTDATIDDSAVVFTGLFGGDSVVLDAAGAFADPKVGNDKTVSLTLNYFGADAGNYTITGQANTTASILPGPAELVSQLVLNAYEKEVRNSDDDRLSSTFLIETLDPNRTGDSVRYSAGLIRLPDGTTSLVDTAGDNDFTRVAEPGSLEVALGRSFRFKLPGDIFEHSNPKEPITVEAFRANGNPLPGWLQYNPLLQTFSGKADEGQEDLEIILRARDSQGNEVETSIRLKFEQGGMGRIFVKS